MIDINFKIKSLILFIIFFIFILPLTTAEGTCGDVNLTITNFCYEITEDNVIFKIEIINYGSYSPLAISLFYNDLFETFGYTEYMWMEESKWNQGEEEAYTEFKNGKKLNLEYSPSSIEESLELKKLSEITIAPTEMRDWNKHCLDLRVKPEKITNCITKEQIWPTKNIFKNIGLFGSNTNFKVKNLIISINFNKIYIILIIVLIATAIFFLLKKVKKFKVKRKKLVTLPEKPVSAIPKIITTAISIKNFTVKYRNTNILDNVSLETKRENLVCVLGPSGTGKSTIIEALMGRKTPTSGTIKIFDQSIKNKGVYDYVGFVPQNPELYMNQTVEENLLSSATKWGIKNPEYIIKQILSTIGLIKRKDLKASKLSGGQIKLLSLGMELIRNPELLILDEPTTGLDPNTRNNIITILSRIVIDKKKTVFFSTHYMDDAEECDEVIIISQGKIVAQGAPKRLKKRLPSGGKIVNVILDNVTNDLLREIKNLPGVEEVISGGRDIKIITQNPSAVKLAQKIEGLGGIVNKTEIINATMEEVFVYYTKKEQ